MQALLRLKKRKKLIRLVIDHKRARGPRRSTLSRSRSQIPSKNKKEDIISQGQNIEINLQDLEKVSAALQQNKPSQNLMTRKGALNKESKSPTKWKKRNHGRF